MSKDSEEKPNGQSPGISKPKAIAGWRCEKLRLDAIRLDGDTQSRVDLDQDVIADYAEAMKSANGAIMLGELTVYFDGVDFWLVDGFHRWHAARKVGATELWCLVRDGSLEAARWYSYSVNRTHGLRRTNADKAKAVKAALLHPNGAKMSDRQIAEYVGVSNHMVSDHRKKLESTVKLSQSPERTGRDGRTTNTANIGKSAEPAPNDSEAEQKARLQTKYDACKELLGKLWLSGPVLDAAEKIVKHGSPSLIAAVKAKKIEIVEAGKQIKLNRKPCAECGFHEFDDVGCLVCKRIEEESYQAAADAVGVPVEMVKRAEKVLAYPEVSNRVNKGEIDLTEAEKIVTVEVATDGPFNVMLERAKLDNTITTILAQWPQSERRAFAGVLEERAAELRREVDEEEAA